jgi:hypothetical protein
MDYGKYAKRKKCVIKRELRFIDSFRFMASNCDSLLKNVTNHPNPGEFYSEDSPEGGLQLLLKKGVYDYVDSAERFSNTQLSPKEAFYTKLNDEGIFDEEYDHAQEV